MNRWTKLISAISALLVFALAAAAFRLSYDALNALAIDTGVATRLAYLFPLVVDGFIVVASLSILYATLRNEATSYPWSLLALFTALSIMFNILHAPDNWLAQVVGAVPPVALALALHLLTAQIRSAISDNVNAIATGETQVVAEPTAETARLQIGQAALTPAERQSHILALIEAQEYAGLQKAAEALRVSASTVRGDLRTLAQAGAIERQGKGAFVAIADNGREA